MIFDYFIDLTIQTLLIKLDTYLIDLILLYQYNYSHLVKVSLICHLLDNSEACDSQDEDTNTWYP